MCMGSIVSSLSQNELSGSMRERGLGRDTDQISDRAPFDGWAGDYALPGQYKVSPGSLTSGLESGRLQKLMRQSRIITIPIPRTLAQLGSMYVTSNGFFDFLAMTAPFFPP